MSTAQQDTEITLGTGRMLAIFFTFVLVCAFFFSIGFSLGRRTTITGSLGIAQISATQRPVQNKKYVAINTETQGGGSSELNLKI